MLNQIKWSNAEFSLQAVAKGLKDPSFRVIQNHFAVSENVGDVVAKVIIVPSLPLLHHRRCSSSNSITTSKNDGS